MINLSASSRRTHGVAFAPPIAEQRQIARRDFSKAIGRMAIASLYDELILYPKPGLVSLVDSGSHRDMNAETFFRSIFSLRAYFVQITESGMRAESFHALKQLGIAAEKRMLQATAGINTHRGAIFALGLLCASVGYCHRQKQAMTPTNIRTSLASQWGAELLAHAEQNAMQSHGSQVARLHAATGAREEAALAMPSVFDIALPRLQATLDNSGCWERARVDALFALMASISDTNVYFRGGADGARIVKECAATFLARGGTAAPDWREFAIRCHHRFIKDRLSPGGAADLLGASCFIYKALQSADHRDGRLPHESV